VPSITISDEELHSLTNAVLRRYGIDFTCYEPSSLKRRVSRSISVLRLDSVHNLWVKLLRDRSFIYLWIDELSVGLTAMFRDPVLWQCLRDEILPTLRWQDRIHLWYAGCSTGEEVYTMSIVVQESGLATKVSALATDISEAAVEKARLGTYHSLKMTDYAKNYRHYNPRGSFRYYCVGEPADGTLKPALVSQVDFQTHNLITELPPRRFDIIFCRNVMIYFDHASKVRLLDQFHEYLNEGGYLVIGFYDSLVPLIDKTKYRIANLETKVFQKI
jgi:chemotaxis protein methyltransferase CheR